MSDGFGDDANDVDKNAGEEALVMTGTTTHRWVERDPVHFDQLQTYNYTQSAMESVFIRGEIDKLKVRTSTCFS